jgi:hypothetical protein
VGKEGFGSDDPLFPATKIALGANRHFTAVGLDRKHWRDAGAIRRIFKQAFERAGLPNYNPHSFRHTLAVFGEKICRAPERATESPVDFVTGMITAVLSAATFIVILWTIGGALTVHLGGMSITIPGFLVVGAHRLRVLGKINRLAERASCVFKCCKVTAAPAKPSTKARSMALSRSEPPRSLSISATRRSNALAALVRPSSSRHVSSGGLPCASGDELVSLGFRVGNPSAIGGISGEFSSIPVITPTTSRKIATRSLRRKMARSRAES